MYQYVYPLMGLMTECQYDLCKRDFALDQVEAWAAANPGGVNEFRFVLLSCDALETHQFVRFAFL